MEKNVFVETPMAGTVQIDPKTLVLFWERKDVDLILKQYAKKYLVYEGFIEQIIGTLDPAPDREIIAFLESIPN